MHTASRTFLEKSDGYSLSTFLHFRCCLDSLRCMCVPLCVSSLSSPVYQLYPLSTPAVRCPYFGEIWSTLLVGESSSSSRGRLLESLTGTSYFDRVGASLLTARCFSYSTSLLLYRVTLPSLSYWFSTSASLHCTLRLGWSALVCMCCLRVLRLLRLVHDLWR